MTDPIAHICSGWCNHPAVPTVIVTLAYLDKLRAAGVTLAPTPPDAPDEGGITQRAHVPCCWCGEHHEEGN